MSFFEAIVAVVPIIMIFSIPIVAIMTAHQRKMAELYAQQGQMSNSGAVDRLAHEVAELRSLVHQQALELDNVSNSVRRLEQRTATQAPDVASRLNV